MGLRGDGDVILETVDKGGREGARKGSERERGLERRFRGGRMMGGGKDYLLFV